MTLLWHYLKDSSNKTILFVTQILFDNQSEQHFFFWFLQHVTGEVYEMGDDVFKICDELEGHPHYYERDFIDLQPGSGSVDAALLESQKVWTYFLKKYNPALMELPFIACYDSFSSAKKFIVVEDRTPDQTHRQKKYVMQTQ